MLKCCSPFYQEASALEYCYQCFSSQMYSFTFSGKGRSLPSQKSYQKSPWEASRPSLLHIRVAPADWRGAPVTSPTTLRSSWCTWAPGPLCRPVYFGKWKWGHVWQAQVSHWRQEARIPEPGAFSEPRGRRPPLLSLPRVWILHTMLQCDVSAWGSLLPVLPTRAQVSPHLPPFYFCHELVSCVLWLSEPGALKSKVHLFVLSPVYLP